MLSDLLEFSKGIDIPQGFMDKYISHCHTNDKSPITSCVFVHTREDSSALIRLLSDEMARCPFESIDVKLEEVVSDNGMKRRMTVIGKVDKSRQSELKKFKEAFYGSVCQLEEFFSVDVDESWRVSLGKTVGEELDSPKVYDINGNAAQLLLIKGNTTLIVVWRNEDAFKRLGESIKRQALPSQLNIVSVSLVERNFFQRKEFLIDQGYSQLMTHYFEGDASKAHFIYSDAPWLIVLDKKRRIQYDALWQGQDVLEMVNALSKGDKVVECDKDNEPYLNANDFWWSVSNQNKESYMQIISEELAHRDMLNLHFSISSEIIINKAGIQSFSVKPQLNGSITADKKQSLIDLIEDLKKNGSLSQIAVNVSYITTP